jgi:hypothetical protein
MYNVMYKEAVMANMVRKQIYIAKRQQAALRRLAEAEGVSEAEIIRQAIDQRAAGAPAQRLPADTEAWEQGLAFMRALQAQGPLPNQKRTWRREDAYAEREARYDRKHSD